MTIRLHDRYGEKNPHTLRHQLQTIKQLVDENLESYAEHVQQLAYDVYLAALDTTIQDACIRAFLRGAPEKRTASMAMDKDPKTLDETMSLVKSAIHSQRAIFGDSTSVKPVTFAGEGDDTNAQELAVRRLDLKPVTPEVEGSVDKVTSVLNKLGEVLQGM